MAVILSMLHEVDSQGGAPIQYNIMEEEPGGTRIGDIATDAGIQDIDPQMTFAIANPSGSIPNLDYLTLDVSSGRPLLLTTESINREKICPQVIKCDIQFNIIVQPIEFFQIIKVQVTILDRNDNEPTFPQQSISTAISESAMPGTTFAVPSAEDLDSGVNGIKTYLLRPEEGKFGLVVTNSADGSVDLRLVLREKLDREVQDTYLLTVIAVDGGTPPRSGSMAVQVQVSDANDNSPTFTESNYEVTIREDVPIGYTIIQFSATDPDVGLNGQVTYHLAESTLAEFGSLFGIHEETGQLFTKMPIRFEEGTSYHLSVMAVDRGPNSLPTYIRILIHVLDVNNHAPEISVNALTQSGHAEVVENAGVGLFVAHISVKDADSGINGEINCTLHSEYFQLEPLFDKEFKVVATAVFDREVQDEYHINVVCQDRGDPPLTSTLHIPVTVVDDNDHTPEFGSPVYSAVIPENNNLGISITQVSATDKDTGENAAINYRTLYPQDADIIRVSPVSGLITANTVFDYETQMSYEIPILAYDQAEGLSRTATALVKITIVDTNDEPPKFILGSYVFNVEENRPKNTTVGTIAATDSDSEPFNEIQYKLNPESEGFQLFSLDSMSGRLSTTQSLDREVKSEYHLVVTTMNPAYPELTSSVNVTVRVNDVNDNNPVIVFPNEKNNTIALSNKLPKGYLIAKIQATDPDDGFNSALNYYFSKEEKEQDLFTLDSNTGEIRVKDELIAVDQSKVKIAVTVLDNGHPPLEANSKLYVTVNGSIPFLVSHPEAEAGSKASEGGAVFTTQKWLTVGIIIGVFVLIVIIVLFIAGCRRRRHKKYSKKHMYNCRLEEALKKQHSQSATNGQPLAQQEETQGKEPAGSHKKNPVVENGECLRPSSMDDEKQKITLDLQMEVGESYTEEASPDDWPARMDAALIMNPKMQTSLLSRNNSTSTRGSIPSDSEFKQAYDQWKHMQIKSKQQPQQHPIAAPHSRRSPLSPLTEMEKEVQDMMKMLATEKQGDSDSLTDSGKGPSEPGEAEKQSEQKRNSSEELPLADVQALDKTKKLGLADNYVLLEDPSRHSQGQLTRHDSYERTNKDAGLSVVVRRLSDPVVIPGPGPEVNISKVGHVPGYSSKVPANYTSSSNNSTGSGYTSEEASTGLQFYKRPLPPVGRTLGPDQPYDNYPLHFKGKDSKSRPSELIIYDVPTSRSDEPSRHPDASENSRRRSPRKPQRNKLGDSKKKHTNRAKSRRTPPFDKYPDIVEIAGEDMYSNYDGALEYNREQETQFLNSVYDNMCDGPQRHSSLDSNTSDSVFSVSSSSHSPRRQSPHRHSPHRLSPRLVSPPQVLIPQRLDFEESMYNDSHRQTHSPSLNPVHDRPTSRSPHRLKQEPFYGHPGYSQQKQPSPRRSPNGNYEHISLLESKSPVPCNGNNNNKRIMYRDPEECRDSAISEGGSSHGSGENLQNCVRDVVSQYMPGKTRSRDGDSIDGLSMDSTTTSGSYVVDPEEYTSPNRANLQLFGKEYLIV